MTNYLRFSTKEYICLYPQLNKEKTGKPCKTNVYKACPANDFLLI